MVGRRGREGAALELIRWRIDRKPPGVEQCGHGEHDLGLCQTGSQTRVRTQAKRRKGTRHAVLVPRQEVAVNSKTVGVRGRLR